MMETMSEEAEIIKTYNAGYRNEAYSSGKCPNTLEKVMSYEVLELGNLDILNTLRTVYDAKIDMRRNIKVSVAQALQFVQEQLGGELPNIQAFWLCSSLDEVKQWYMRPSSDADIWRYTIAGEFMCISDLGPEGVLVAYDSEKTRVTRQPIGV